MYPRIRTIASLIYTRRRRVPASTVPTLATRAFHSSPAVQLPTSQKHSTDAYNKDVDTTPPEDTTTYHVDPEAEVQKSTAPPSGDWSRAGAQTNEYEHVDKTSKPYAVPGQSQRYGNTDVRGPETSRPDEGPEGKSSRGRKPEEKRK